MLPPVLVLSLLGFVCAEVFPGLGLAFAGVYLLIGSLWSWSGTCQAVVVHRLPQILVLPLLGCCCEQVSPSHGLAFAGLWLCTRFPSLGLVFDEMWF